MTKYTYDINDFEDIVVAGVDPTDYPDFCDAYFQSATYRPTGADVPEDVLDALAEMYPDILQEKAYEQMTGKRV